jgi:hypothetical protein
VIGGVDIVVPTRASAGNSLIASLRIIRQAWPTAVIENALTGEKLELGKGVLLPDSFTDLFVYPSAQIAAQWNELGAEPELANTMIHLLVRLGEITVVVDDPRTEPIRSMLAAIRDALRMDVFTIRVDHAVTGEAA